MFIVENDSEIKYIIHDMNIKIYIKSICEIKIMISNGIMDLFCRIKVILLYYFHFLIKINFFIKYIEKLNINSVKTINNNSVYNIEIFF